IVVTMPQTQQISPRKLLECIWRAIPVANEGSAKSHDTLKCSIACGFRESHRSLLLASVHGGMPDVRSPMRVGVNMRKLISFALTIFAFVIIPTVASAETFEKKNFNYSEWTKGRFSEAVTLIGPGKMIFLAGVGSEDENGKGGDI